MSRAFQDCLQTQNVWSSADRLSTPTAHGPTSDNGHHLNQKAGTGTKRTSPPPPPTGQRHVFEDTHQRTHIIAIDQESQDNTGGCFSFDAHNSLKHEGILFGSVASLHYLEDPCWDPAVADPPPPPQELAEVWEELVCRPLCPSPPHLSPLVWSNQRDFDGILDIHASPQGVAATYSCILG